MSAKKLETARKICGEEEIESVADLREHLTIGTLDQLGFTKLTLSKIKVMLPRDRIRLRIYAALP
eukprot:SAG11_NODE_716_length_7614_cov_63.924837_4_plen_65_part_00